MAERYESATKVATILYAVSFLLPATISGSQWWWGWTVALLSLLPPLILLTGPSNIGFIVAMLCLRGGSFRSAVIAASLSVASMIYCGVMTPSSPGTDFLKFPGGWLGPAYYLWLVSGVLLLCAAIAELLASRGTQPVKAGTS